MPVIVKNKTENAIDVTVTNAHLKALQEITDILGTKGDAHTIAFLIEIMRDHGSKDIRINNCRYRPSVEIRTKKGDHHLPR